jgi:Golgi phosphoprotein 3 (GPP34)
VAEAENLSFPDIRGNSSGTTGRLDARGCVWFFGVEWLCDDLLLLTVFAYRGRLAHATGYALMGAELIRLAAMGRIGIVEDMIVITSEEPTGDAELDAALTEIGESEDPPWPDEWVAQPRPRIAGRYLERLEAAGVVRAQTRFSATRWLVTDGARLAEARGRLDAIAGSVGEVDLTQTAYAGLACAIGLDYRLYRGRGQSAERDRLQEIAAGGPTVRPAAGADFAGGDFAGGDFAGGDFAGGDSADIVEAATLAAIEAVTQAAVGAASQAAAQAMASTADLGYGGA